MLSVCIWLGLLNACVSISAFMGVVALAGSVSARAIAMLLIVLLVSFASAAAFFALLNRDDIA